MDEKVILKLSEVLHLMWIEEKENEGYHLPRLCPNYESKEEDDEDVDLIHCNKCLSNLQSFNELSEFQKNKYKEKAEKIYLFYKENNLNITLG